MTAEMGLLSLFLIVSVLIPFDRCVAYLLECDKPTSDRRLIP